MTDKEKIREIVAEFQGKVENILLNIPARKGEEEGEEITKQWELEKFRELITKRFISFFIELETSIDELEEASPSLTYYQSELEVEKLKKFREELSERYGNPATNKVSEIKDFYQKKMENAGLTEEEIAAMKRRIDERIRMESLASNLQSKVGRIYCPIVDDISSIHATNLREKLEEFLKSEALNIAKISNRQNFSKIDEDNKQKSTFFF